MSLFLLLLSLAIAQSTLVFPPSFTGVLTVISSAPIAYIANNTLLNVFVANANDTALFDKAASSLFVSSSSTDAAWLLSTTNGTCQLTCQAAACLSPLLQPFQAVSALAQPIPGAPQCYGQGQWLAYTDMSRFLGFLFCADAQNSFPVFMSIVAMRSGFTISVTFSSYSITPPPPQIFQQPIGCK